MFYSYLQVTARIECATTKRIKKLIDPEITYHKIQNKLYFVFEKKRKSKSYTLIAKPEKAIIDLILLNKITKEETHELIKKMNKDLILEWLKDIDFKGKKKIIEWIKC